jgi:ABC-type transport system substrate-binding protein
MWKVEALDDTTVKVNFKHPGDLVLAFVNPFGMIIPAICSKHIKAPMRERRTI